MRQVYNPKCYSLLKIGFYFPNGKHAKWKALLKELNNILPEEQKKTKAERSSEICAKIKWGGINLGEKKSTYKNREMATIMKYMGNQKRINKETGNGLTSHKSCTVRFRSEDGGRGWTEMKIRMKY